MPHITRRVVDGLPYLGLGLGAQSFTHSTISYNDGAATKELLPYLRSVDPERLPLQDLGKQLPERVGANNLDEFPPRNLDALIEAVNRLGIRQVVAA